MEILARGVKDAYLTCVSPFVSDLQLVSFIGLSFVHKLGRYLNLNLSLSLRNIGRLRSTHFFEGLSACNRF